MVCELKEVADLTALHNFPKSLPIVATSISIYCTTRSMYPTNQEL